MDLLVKLATNTICQFALFFMVFIYCTYSNKDVFKYKNNIVGKYKQNIN